MTKKEDLRIRKTKANLYKGLISMLEEKSFEEIKVTDICQIALVNRSTFYDHFNDKYELLTSLIDDIKKEVKENLKVEKEVTSVKEYCLELIKELMEYLDKNLDLYSKISILKKNNNSVAYDIVVDAAQANFMETINEKFINTSKIPTELIVMFYISGVMKVSSEAIKDSQKFNIEKIIEYLDLLLPDLDFMKKK